jgi:hypothetical protein
MYFPSLFLVQFPNLKGITRDFFSLPPLLLFLEKIYDTQKITNFILIVIFLTHLKKLDIKKIKKKRDKTNDT